MKRKWNENGEDMLIEEKMVKRILLAREKNNMSNKKYSENYSV